MTSAVALAVSAVSLVALGFIGGLLATEIRDRKRLARRLLWAATEPRIRPDLDARCRRLPMFRAGVVPPPEPAEGFPGSSDAQTLWR